MTYVATLKLRQLERIFNHELEPDTKRIVGEQLCKRLPVTPSSFRKQVHAQLLYMYALSLLFWTRSIFQHHLKNFTKSTSKGKNFAKEMAVAIAKTLYLVNSRFLTLHCHQSLKSLISVCFRCSFLPSIRQRPQQKSCQILVLTIHVWVIHKS